jgi:[ribosomal protein S5]-alanine N-acetyltransferase
MPASLHDDIMTDRLELIPITYEAIQSERSRDGRLGELIRCKVPAEWPPPHWEAHVFDFMLSQFERFPDQFGWPRYIAARNPDSSRTLIGSIGAYSRTDPPQECEIGYSILPRFEGQGFATEATLAIIDFLRKDSRITSVIADAHPSMTGSIRVLERCGLTLDGEGEQPGTLRYRLHLRPDAN